MTSALTIIDLFRVLLYAFAMFVRKLNTKKPGVFHPVGNRLISAVLYAGCVWGADPGTRQNDPVYTEILEQYLQTDVASVIGIHNRQEVEAKRQALIKLVWGTEALPRDALPQKVRRDISDPNYADILQLRSIDSLECDMPKMINSVLYYFHARKPNGKLVIYHPGQRGDYRNGKDTIRGLVGAGFDV
ncbi:MAG: hypothetical protein KJT03_04795, partial [Verrucomicrobiae bacterium]|nr:hypothetical protein [Verrucomicrobiae bacterium]